MSRTVRVSEVLEKMTLTVIDGVEYYNYSQLMVALKEAGFKRYNPIAGLTPPLNYINQKGQLALIQKHKQGYTLKVEE